METPESVIPRRGCSKARRPACQSDQPVRTGRHPRRKYGDGVPTRSQPTPFSGLTSSIEHLLMAIRRRGTLQENIREHNDQVSELRIRMGALETGGAVLGQDAQEQEQVITAAKTAAHDAIEQL